MDKQELSGSNFDGGFNKLISEDDLQHEEHPPYPHSNHTSRGKVWQGKLSSTWFTQWT